MERLTEDKLKLIEQGNLKLWEKCGFIGAIIDIKALVAEVKACWETKKPVKKYYWQKKEGDK